MTFNRRKFNQIWVASTTTLMVLVLLFMIVASIWYQVPNRPRQKALCRHIVLAQYAAFKDAGYDVEIWQFVNKFPSKANGFKSHVALRVKKGKSNWVWVKQPATTYTTTSRMPKNTILLRKMDFLEIVEWVDKPNSKGE